ncbi:MAG TPA: glycoside hydrolase family 2 TIM barrel-domain containing protein [Thermoanaerobaculia bacterium]|nr:glycoside hydrolase family 2 TIM barrel-domain containing protein [Thermoanaerobaculia bacterium]
MDRGRWISLNGQWDFALDAEDRFRTPGRVPWERRITVPFSPEAPASGIGDTGLYQAVWYRRSVAPPPLAEGERLLLHFGAVDHVASVFWNGIMVGAHVGGYTPFTIELTHLLEGEEEHELVVRAEDDPADLAKPRGKQDWKLEPHGIWYPRTTGIWQTVWLEVVPRRYFAYLRWTPNVERWEIGIETAIAGGPSDDLTVAYRLQARGSLLAEDTCRVVAGEVHRRIVLSDPGIDDYRNELLWSPARPTLIEAEIELRGRDGSVVDRLESYTAIRAIGTQGDRFMLNGRPFPLRMVLDQGYWPETGLTAPDDEALRRDVLLVKHMGFNGVRKHQKVEDPRYLYWADRLGLIVWEEMPSAYRFTRESVERLTREWIDVVKRDVSHPCIVAWVPFNESWGVPNLPENPAERDYVQALYHLTKTIDPTRPVIGNDGWESVATDILGVHDYDTDPERLARRYQTEEVLPSLLRRERPGGRLLVLKEHARQPLMLSEFGGITLDHGAVHHWGYRRVPSAEAFEQLYRRLLAAVRGLDVLAGFCYTQFADTYQETNGLLYADRTPKFSLDAIAEASGIVPEMKDTGASTPDPTRLKARMALPAQAPEGPQQTAETPSASLPPAGSSV